MEDDPQAIAKLFLGRRGLSRQMIGEFLGTLHSPFHASVLEYDFELKSLSKNYLIYGFRQFVGNISMYKMETDVAIRHMLTFFRLPGEAQKIDHIVQVCFSCILQEKIIIFRHLLKDILHVIQIDFQEQYQVILFIFLRLQSLC